MVKSVKFAHIGLLLLTLTPLQFSSVLYSSVYAQPNLLYSFVHLTDTQTLSERFPKTLNSTFQYLEQAKSEYNIKRIIVTGDLVEHWYRASEWQNFLSAMTLTSIGVDSLAGNHDTDSGRNFTHYNQYIGADKQYYYQVLEDFMFMYVSWPNPNNRLNQTILTYLDNAVNSHQSKILVFATHYYSDEDSTGYRLSALGKQLLNLSRTPALVLMGHIHGSWVNTRNVRETPVYEFNTNHQNTNSSYVRIFSIYSDATIHVKVIRVEPKPLATTSTFILSYSLTAQPTSQVTFTSTGVRTTQTSTQREHLTYVIVGIVVAIVIIGLIAARNLRKKRTSVSL